MPPRRVVALAQVLTMILLLVPGQAALGPAPAQAAVAPANSDIEPVHDANGPGLGCRAGTRKFKGPKLPKDPPWPPGTRPERTPEPSPEPSAAASAEPVASDGEEPEPSAEGAAAGTAFLAATGIRTAQLAEPESSEAPAQPSTPPEPQASSAPGAAPAEDGLPPSDVDDADIEPDVTTAPETRQGGRRNRLIKGIDVSHHNGDIDYAKVRKAGHRFVFMKATQDNAFIDPMFPTNLARARAAGLSVGAYHFFDYSLDGRVQADHFLDRVESFGGVDGALPPVVDVECWPPLGASLHVAAETRLRDFVARVYERIGRLPIIYTSVFMWAQVVGNASGFEQHPLWAACWGCDMPPSLAPGWDEWAFWQTGVGRIPGVGRLDANFFSGKARDLKALELRPILFDGGAYATDRRQVEVDLGGRDATHLRTSSDGETWSGWERIRSRPQVTLGPEEGSQEIFVQLRAGPGLTSPAYSESIVLDQTGPLLEDVMVALGRGPVGVPSEGESPGEGSRVPLAISWTAQDALSGLSDASLSLACGSDAEHTSVPGAAFPGESMPWAAATTIETGATCDVRVIGHDGAGNRTPQTIEGVEVAIAAPAASDPASASVEGRQVGVIARPGPDAGRANVLLDGNVVGEVDLYAPIAGGPEVVFVADLVPGAAAEITLQPTGTSHAQVTVDGFVTLR